MNKKTIIITISSIALLGAGIGLLVYFNKKKKDEEETDDFGATVKDVENKGGGLGTVDETEFSASNPIVGSTSFTVGSKGRKIAVLQALLNHYKKASPKLTIDGEFGGKTVKALFDAGYYKCAIAKTCNLSTEEFLKLFKLTENDKSFKNTYNPKVNVDMKAVYTKYSS